MPGSLPSRGLRAHSARALVVLAVSAVVAAVAAGLLAAGTDRAEVLATLLFVPVFAAGLLAGRRPGWVAAAVATVVYLALRSADADDAGLVGVVVLAATRAVAYAVAAEVGLRAQSLAERLAEGNEWDDSPLVARGRALSKRERPGHDSFEAGEPTSVWVTTPDDDPAHVPAPGLAPAGVGAMGSAWRDAEAPTAPDTGWPPEPPPPPSPPAWSDPYGSPAVAAPPGLDAWLGGPPPPASPAAAWSDPYGSPAVAPPPAPWSDPHGSVTVAPPPAPWSDPYGSPAVAPPPAPWSDPYGSPAVPVPPPAPPPPLRPSPPPPPIDAETRLWTARFLCDRIAAEKAHCERTGDPFSLVLVQVPDEPFATLPYRRQVTLLRELGHQFVAGGVIDHLVHVPDRSQHWFAVVLPDIDRGGAQLLERRLRTGIGGYLRSRGLPLPDLESASLTSPDDDAALGEIWDALAGHGDAAAAVGDEGPAMAYDA